MYAGRFQSKQLKLKQLKVYWGSLRNSRRLTAYMMDSNQSYIINGTLNIRLYVYLLHVVIFLLSFFCRFWEQGSKRNITVIKIEAKNKIIIRSLEPEVSRNDPQSAKQLKPTQKGWGLFLSFSTWSLGNKFCKCLWCHKQ